MPAISYRQAHGAEPRVPRQSDDWTPDRIELDSDYVSAALAAELARGPHDDPGDGET